MDTNNIITTDAAPGDPVEHAGGVQPKSVEIAADDRTAAERESAKHVDNFNARQAARAAAPVELPFQLPVVELPATLVEAHTALADARLLPQLTRADILIKQNRIKKLMEHIYELGQIPAGPRATIEQLRGPVYEAGRRRADLAALAERFPLFKDVMKAGLTVLLLLAMLTSGKAQNFLGTNAAPSAPGATGGVFTLLNGGTNNLTGATTNAVSNLVIACYGHYAVGVTLGYNAWLSTATNGNVVLGLERTYDGLNYETTPYCYLTNALPTAVQWAAGQTNPVVNFDLPGLQNARAVQIVSEANTGASAAWITNLLVEYSINNQTWFTAQPFH